jgi:hypothetical protein
MSLPGSDREENIHHVEHMVLGLKASQPSHDLDAMRKNHQDRSLCRGPHGHPGRPSG